MSSKTRVTGTDEGVEKSWPSMTTVAEGEIAAPIEETTLPGVSTPGTPAGGDADGRRSSRPGQASTGGPRPARLPAPARPGARADRGYIPADLIVLAYLAITGVLVLFSADGWRTKEDYVAIHFGYLLAVALLALARRSGPPLLHFFRLTYPLASLPLLYQGVQHLNRITTQNYFDDLIIQQEALLFSCQPSQVFHAILPWAVLSELLHVAYLSYTLVFAVIALTLYFSRRYEPLKVFISTIMLTFLSCYLIFTFFPVQGPFHHFGPLVPTGEGGVFQSLTHRLLTQASSVGTAFPSSHVAASVAAWLVCRRYLRRFSWAVLLIAGGITIGTVYGGFHYAIDALAGLVVGITTGLLGPRIHGWIERAARLRPRTA
ncbi:MAG: inositol phosphorylceramide synthase [Candidatus Eisenbacteria sp.]|nr:inositol phosphorylceramide synthase [Candidatus Eisenbacteria bacterium]